MHFMVTQDGDLESDEEDNGRGNSAEANVSSRGSRRSQSSGTAGSSSRERSAGSGGGMVSADVEEVVKREIESATGSRLAQVSSSSLLDKLCPTTQSSRTFFYGELVPCCMGTRISLCPW